MELFSGTPLYHRGYTPKFYGLKTSWGGEYIFTSCTFPGVICHFFTPASSDNAVFMLWRYYRQGKVEYIHLINCLVCIGIIPPRLRPFLKDTMCVSFYYILFDANMDY